MRFSSSGKWYCPVCHRLYAREKYRREHPEATRRRPVIGAKRTAQLTVALTDDTAARIRAAASAARLGLAAYVGQVLERTHPVEAA